MKELLILASAALAVIGLIILQFRSMRKSNPNAELLVGLWELVESDSAKKENKKAAISPLVDSRRQSVKNSVPSECQAVRNRETPTGFCDDLIFV